MSNEKLGKRLERTLKSKAAQLMGLKVKPKKMDGICRRLECTNKATNKGQVWCVPCRDAIRKQQMYFAAETYREGDSTPERLHHAGAPPKKAVLNPGWYRKALANKKNHTGKLADPAFRKMLLSKLDKRVDLFVTVKKVKKSAAKAKAKAKAVVKKAAKKTVAKARKVASELLPAVEMKLAV